MMRKRNVMIRNDEVMTPKHRRFFRNGNFNNVSTRPKLYVETNCCLAGKQHVSLGKFRNNFDEDMFILGRA